MDGDCGRRTPSLGPQLEFGVHGVAGVAARGATEEIRAAGLVVGGGLSHFLTETKPF